MEQPKTKEKAVLRSYEREILRIEGSSIIEYAMTNMADRGEMLPKLVEILPQKEVEESLPYPHEGEEFVYVLELSLIHILLFITLRLSSEEGGAAGILRLSACAL